MADSPKHWVPAGLSPDAIYALGYEHGKADASWIGCDRHGGPQIPDTPTHRNQLEAAGWMFAGDSQICLECAALLAGGVDA